jgi:hypothetical protein
VGEQRNQYKGAPARPWIRVTLVAAGGATQELDALADTGNPCRLIVGSDMMRQFNLGLEPDVHTNFGILTGGWLRIRIVEIGFDQVIRGFGGDAVVTATQASHPDLQGLAGLPLLRMMEYGGDRQEFWVRR